LNYSQLVTAIEDYTGNSESSFIANIPLFVQQAEERIYNSVQIPALRKNQLGAMTSGNQYLSLPADWLYTYSLAVIDPASNQQMFLLNKDVNYIRQAFPNAAANGMPTHYAVFDEDSLILGPTPDLNYSVELHYGYYPPSIVTAGTSWIGDNFETVLLYGSLREAYLYMKGDQDMVGYYETKYQEGILLLKQLAEGKNRQDMYRTPQARYPVG